MLKKYKIEVFKLEQEYCKLRAIQKELISVEKHVQVLMCGFWEYNCGKNCSNQELVNSTRFVKNKLCNRISACKARIEFLKDQ